MLRQVEKLLQNKKGFQTLNKVFHKHSSNGEEKLKLMFDVDKEYVQDSQINFENISNWINKHTAFDELNKNFLNSDLTQILVNLTTYENTWHRSESKEAYMKVYNSFNYTEDIKYEARVLELPLKDDDFKLVVLVPNESDVLNGLFDKLSDEGLTAATNSIKPLFTSVCELKAPYLVFNSEIITPQKISNSDVNMIVTEFGNVKIDEHGVLIKVVTCITSNNDGLDVTEKMEFKEFYNPFYFAIIFKDIPIFTGNYVSLKK